MIKLLVLALLAVALFFGARSMTLRKQLIAERQAIDADWAEVDTALRQRAVLTGDFARLVQAEAPAEQAALFSINDAREQVMSARERLDKMQANARLDRAIAELMLRVEMYPKLENSRKYSDLLDALKNAEYQIAEARRKYNEAVEHYNARLELFPTNIVSSVYGLRKLDAYFQTPAI